MRNLNIVVLFLLSIGLFSCDYQTVSSPVPTVVVAPLPTSTAVSPTFTPTIPPISTATITATATKPSIPEIHPFTDDALQSQIDRLAYTFLAANKASALSVAVVRRNQQTGELEALLLNYGSTEKEGGHPVTSDTLYEIGSLTKPFTGIMLGEAVNAGSIKLEDPIQNYLPQDIQSPDYGGIPIKVIDLATHHAGLPRDLASDDIDDLYTWLNTYKLRHAPGAQYLYSNLGYSLLGDILARLAKSSYNDLEFQSVSRPLGLTDTVVTLSTQQKNRLAQGYDFQGASGQYIPDTGAMAPAGYLRSTLNDMTRFLIANMNPNATALSSSIKLAQTLQATGADPDSGVGLGWEISQPGSRAERIWKSGATYSFSSYLSFQADGSSGFVAMTNGLGMEYFADDVLRLLKQSGG